MNDRIALVNEVGEITGFEEKLLVHQRGLLHRAFSIFVFNSKNEILLHQRAKYKYHSGGLWTNTCCSHQREGFSLEESIQLRLKEEMGFNCPVVHLFNFSYKTHFHDGLIENEFDHVYSALYENDPIPNYEEVMDWEWIPYKEVLKDLEENPAKFTVWFQMAYPRVVRELFD